MKDQARKNEIPDNISGNRQEQLTAEEIRRYSRQLMLPEIGVEGQKRLKAARALIIGAGGLGSPLGLYLAAAGIGTLGIADFDSVEESNLQRQIIHSTNSVGKLKTTSAKERINALNPHVKTVEYNAGLNMSNAFDIIKEYDLVLDGTDNFTARYFINDACVLAGIPYVYGSVYEFTGQAGIFYAKKGPCYRCAFPAPPRGAAPAGAIGVMGVMPGIIGCIQAAEAIKFIVGIGDSLVGRLLLADALSMEFQEIKLEKEPNCPVCGKNR